jgi:hypothetical protein
MTLFTYELGLILMHLTASLTKLENLKEIYIKKRVRLSKFMLSSLVCVLDRVSYFLRI